MNEQRQLPRWEVKKKVRVWMPQTGDFVHCTIEDLHLKGMRVSLSRPLPQQEPVGMSFVLGDDFEFIKIEATVPWSRAGEGCYVYGLSFSKIDDRDKDRLYQYINTHCYDQIKDKWWA